MVIVDRRFARGSAATNAETHAGSSPPDPAGTMGAPDRLPREDFRAKDFPREPVRPWESVDTNPRARERIKLREPAGRKPREPANYGGLGIQRDPTAPRGKSPFLGSRGRHGNCNEISRGPIGVPREVQWDPIVIHMGSLSFPREPMLSSFPREKCVRAPWDPTGSRRTCVGSRDTTRKS